MRLFDLFEAELDATGWGATPMGGNVAYEGLRVKMKPSVFLWLAHQLDPSSVNPEVEKHMTGGGKIAHPFLQVNIPPEWEDGNFKKTAKVVGHEGRNRMTNWIKMKGDEPVEVHIFPRGGMRRHHITDEMIKNMASGMFNEDGDFTRGPLFDVSTALEEGWKDWVAAGAMGAAALGAQAKAPAMWTEPNPAHAKQKQVQQVKQVAPKQTQTIKAQPKQQAQEPIEMNLLSNNINSEAILHKTAVKSGIRGVELAQFMAQTKHESADFSRMKEIGGKDYFHKRYDPKTAPKTAKILGNTHAGDGIRYHGRGFIQITGRDNYRMAGEYLGLPLEAQPELAARPDVAAKIAVWYWKTRVKPNVANFTDTAAVTKLINPALRGLEDRKANFLDYKRII